MEAAKYKRPHAHLIIIIKHLLILFYCLVHTGLTEEAHARSEITSLRLAHV